MDFFNAEGMQPFVFSAALLFGFLILEIIFMLIGIDTRISSDGDIDVGGDFDTGIGSGDTSLPDIDYDLPDGVEIMPDGLEGAESAASGTTSLGVILDIFGVRKVPLTVWLTLFFAFFASTGFVVQHLLHITIGMMLPSSFACPVALTPALALTRLFSEAIGNRLPRFESTAIKSTSLARRRGVITVGVSKRGKPAEVQVLDQHGNYHYLHLEPVRDDEEIHQGSEVLLLRVRDPNEPKTILRLHKLN